MEPGVNRVFPCNGIQKTAWEALKDFDHAPVLRGDTPLLPDILWFTKNRGLRNGTPSNKMQDLAFKTELAAAYPECRLVVTKETKLYSPEIMIVINKIFFPLFGKVFRRIPTRNQFHIT